ncbi:MAG: hypothetical protein ISS57_01545 [Anaerolineales bacterium]|nr:hypothetical protein [Chloroflexota bacterium]MBL7161260.1 hypothetical protein [Anaerolineales bacterium]
MNDFIVQPNPQINISDQDFAHLPLFNFHIIALVEPDPESWMPFLGDGSKLSSTLELYSEIIFDELDPDEQQTWEGVELASDVVFPRILWVGGTALAFYDEIAEIYARVVFNRDYEEYEDLRFYIQGVAQDHPAWRVAVLGAMFEDDVIRVANAIQESGLETTIIQRYCLSSDAFINLDDLIASIAKLRRKGLLADFRFLDKPPETE